MSNAAVDVNIQPILINAYNTCRKSVCTSVDSTHMYTYIKGNIPFNFTQGSTCPLAQ